MKAINVLMRGLWSLIFSQAIVWLPHAQALAGEGNTVLFRQPIPRVPALWVAPVSVGEKQALVVLDTGAGLTVLDSSLRDALGAKLGERPVTMADGEGTRPSYEGPSLRMGALHSERSPVILSDLGMISEFVGRPLAGVVGMDFMRGKVFLNFDQSVFEIHSGAWRLPKRGSHESALKDDSDVPKFDRPIAGKQVTFILDTGADGTITLAAPVFDALVADGVIEVSKVRGRAVTGQGFDRRANSGWFVNKNVNLMGKDLAGVSVKSSPANSILGLKWLCAFNVEIDMAARKFRFQLRRAAKPPLNVQLMAGAIFFYNERGARIESLRPDGAGAAEEAGLKAGDVIEQFGAIRAPDINAVSLGEAVADAAAKEVAVRYRRKVDGVLVETKLKVAPMISEWDFAGRGIFGANSDR